MKLYAICSYCNHSSFVDRVNPDKFVSRTSRALAFESRNEAEEFQKRRADFVAIREYDTDKDKRFPHGPACFEKCCR